MKFPPSIQAALAMLACALATINAGGAGTPPGTDPLVPERMMARVTDATHLNAFVAAASSTFDDVAVIDSIDGRAIHLLRYRLRAGQSDDTVRAFCDSQVALGVALWAELNYAGQTGEGRTDSFWLSELAIDPSIFEGQYTIGIIDLPAAQARSLGQGVLVAVLDTGVDAAHPAFDGQVQQAARSFVPGVGPGDASNGLDDDGDGLVDEQAGHGTFVAGAVHLVAPRARILPVTVLNSDGVGDLWTIAKGLGYAIDSRADVINMSLGSTYSSRLIEDMVDDAAAHGALVVAAMGNMAREDPEEYPAALTAAFGVCATGEDDHRAPFSNWNPKADLSAPGTTALIDGTVDLHHSVVGPVPGGKWAAWHGTSFATAFVSGTAALLRAQHPEWPDAAVPLPQVGSHLGDLLRDWSLPIDALNPGFEGTLGSGRLRAGIAAAQGPPAPSEYDLDLDGSVGGADIGVLLGAWGQPCGAGCRADINRDGVVDGFDLGLLLGNWG